MKLQECVENIEIEDGKFIHIGSGCGFFFVGTKEEYETLIDQISEEYRIKIEKKMLKCQFELEQKDVVILPEINYKELPETSIFDIKKYCNALIELSVKIDKKIRKRIKLVKRYHRTYHSCMDTLENWVDLRNREVKETYPRASNDGVVIIINGDEMGKAWDRQEFLYGSSDEDEEE